MGNVGFAHPRGNTLMRRVAVTLAGGFMEAYDWASWHPQDRVKRAAVVRVLTPRKLPRWSDL